MPNANLPEKILHFSFCTFHCYRATGNAKYLDLARQVAGRAVDKLYVETELTEDDGTMKKYGLFRGHAAKP